LAGIRRAALLSSPALAWALRIRSANRRLLRGAAVVVLILGLAVLAGTAAAVNQASRPVYQPPQSYYLALGDSMAYGFQPTKAKPGARPSDFTTGYVDVFAARLQKLSPKIDVVNTAAPVNRPSRSPAVVGTVTASSRTTCFAERSSRPPRPS